MDLEHAKELFFQYDGSRFYMSRNSRKLEADYVATAVPAEIEAQWLEELTRGKLQSLSQKSNYLTIHFLRHHRDYHHLAALLQSEPKGVLWERCVFIEQLLSYTWEFLENGGDKSLYSPAVQKVRFEGECLLKRANSKDSIRRVKAILKEARKVTRKTRHGSAR
jgi:hypothetical protein